MKQNKHTTYPEPHNDLSSRQNKNVKSRYGGGRVIICSSGGNGNLSEEEEKMKLWILGLGVESGGGKMEAFPAGRGKGSTCGHYWEMS